MINKIVKYFNNIIPMSKSFIKENNIKTNIRNSKISLNDAVYYKSKYVFSDITDTFQSITANINYDKIETNKKSKIFTRTGIYKNEAKLPVEFYKNIFEKTKVFFYKNFNLKCSFIAIDGVYYNTNFLHNGTAETSMSLGLFDINNSTPIDIHFTGIGKKNNECLSLEKYISENLSKFKNKIIICDRAYHCYRFFNFLDNNNIKFIIRLRHKENLKKPTKYAKHYDDYNNIVTNKNIRIIKRTDNIKKLAVENNDTVKQIISDSTIKIISNLNIKEFSDDNIFNLYKNRWTIEEFYKQLKHNFKFQIMKEYNDKSYLKNIYLKLTFLLLKNILIETYKSENNNKIKKTIINKNKNEQLDVKIKFNENIILKGIKDILLKDIFYEKLSSYKILNFMTNYFKLYSNKVNRSFERKSKIPFTKWYVKKYHDVFKAKSKDLTILIKITDNDEVKNKLKLEIKTMNKNLNKLKKNLKEKVVGA